MTIIGSSAAAVPMPNGSMAGMAFGGGGESGCVQQLLTGQTAALSPDQQVGQKFLSNEWFNMAQITKAQFSLKRASSVDGSLTITCKLLDSDASTVLGTLGTANVSSDLTTSFSFITFEGGDLPETTNNNDMLALSLTGSGWNSGDITAEWSDGTEGSIDGTQAFSISGGTYYGSSDRNSVCKINCG